MLSCTLSCCVVAAQGATTALLYCAVLWFAVLCSVILFPLLPRSIRSLHTFLVLQLPIFCLDCNARLIYSGSSPSHRDIGGRQHSILISKSPPDPVTDPLNDPDLNLDTAVSRMVVNFHVIPCAVCKIRVCSINRAHCIIRYSAPVSLLFCFMV
jgi:hypothetical protein